MGVSSPQSAATSRGQIDRRPWRSEALRRALHGLLLVIQGIEGFLW